MYSTLEIVADSDESTKKELYFVFVDSDFFVFIKI